MDAGLVPKCVPCVAVICVEKDSVPCNHGCFRQRNCSAFGVGDLPATALNQPKGRMSGPPPRFSSSVLLGDLNDFIAPSQACVNPLFAPPSPADEPDAVKRGRAKVSLDSDVFSGLPYVRFVDCVPHSSLCVPLRIMCVIVQTVLQSENTKTGFDQGNWAPDRPGYPHRLPCLQWVCDLCRNGVDYPAECG
jgi:hypothetical protein